MTLICLLLLPAAALAQEDATDSRIRALEQRVQQLEALVEKLAATQPEEPAAAPLAQAPPPPTTAAPLQAPAEGGPLPVYGGASALSKALNPDISLTGNFLSSVGNNPGSPSLEMDEVELGFRAIIDPYMRGDVFFSFGDEGFELEEGYVTLTSLRGGFVGKAGKMRAPFGVVNTLHTHSLPWTDRPLVTENILGGDEGLNDVGLSVSRILPAPEGLFLEATGEVYRGESEGIFEPETRSDVSYLARLRAYRDLTESTNLDLAFSWSRGHNEFGSGFITNLYGGDVTFRWKPLRRAIYKAFTARSEFIWSRRDDPFGAQRAFGTYTSADYRLNRRWTLGGRYDYSDRATEAALTDKGFSAVVTYWPSEFSQFRTQYRFTNFAEGQKTNELRFQLLFVMGAHGAHPF